MKILFATDGSPYSDYALREAARILPLAEASLTVVAVAPPPVIGTDPLGMAAVDGGLLVKEVEAIAQANLEHARTLLEQELQLQASYVERSGVPAHEILELARALKPDLIVLGSHGRGAVERFIIGSVSDAVLHHWHGAIMLVRPE